MPTPYRAGSVAAVLNESYVHVSRAKEEYAACAERQSSGCVATVRSSAIAESRKSSAAEARNNATVRAVEASAGTCVRLEATLVRLLRTAQTSRAPAPVPWRSGDGDSGSGSSGRYRCTSEERAGVEMRVSNPGDSLASAAGDVSSAADAYRHGTDAAINQTLDLVLARANYDTAYAANKTGVLAEVSVHMHVNMTIAAEALAATVHVSLMAMEAGSSEALRATAYEASGALAKVHVETAAAVGQYVATVDVFVEEVTRKMAAAAVWFSFFSGLGILLAPLPGRVKFTPDVSLPTLLPPSAVPDMPTDVTALQAALQAAAEMRVEEVMQATTATLAELGRAGLLIPEAAANYLEVAGLPTLLADYDPPPRGTGGGTANAEEFSSVVRADACARGKVFDNRTDAVASLIEGERAAAAAAAAAADAAANVTSAAESVDLASAAAAAAAAAADVKAKLGAAKGVGEGVAWLGISAPDVDAATTALAALYAAMNGLVGADLAYRAARSAQAVARHFDRKGHTLPPIDLTAADGNTAAREGAGAAVKIAQALGHPACLAAVRAVAASLAATLVSYAYLPFHGAYRRGCVMGCGGTFVTLNMHSLAHNYAASTGSREMAAGVARAEGERRDECSRRAPTSAARLVTSRGVVDAAIAASVRAAAEAALIVRCVDPDEYGVSDASGATPIANGGGGGGFTSDQLTELRRLMHSDAWTQCSSRPAHVDRDTAATTATAIAGAATEFGGGVSATASAGVNIGLGGGDALDASAEFDCGALPACNPTCAGPARRVLPPLAYVSGCAAEVTLYPRS
jgi:hypothetical protein